MKRTDVPAAGGMLAAYRLGSSPTDAAPVLAIHGITSNSRTWLAAAEALDDRAALIAVDLRGRAASRELPGPFGLDAHVRDMVAVLDHLGLQRAVVAGHSLGAYIAARLATAHPDRVHSLVLVDGGLTIPGSEGADPDKFIHAFLGPALQRLRLTFPDVAAYLTWWSEHPAFSAADNDPQMLEDYVGHDLVGEPPQLRCSVVAQAVREDGADLLGARDAQRLTVPAVLLSAPRGLLDDPNPMQPPELVSEWVTQDPSRRRGVQVPDVNHYTIALSTHGGQAVAEEIAVAVSTSVR